jgi:hypothetical protein
VQPYSGTLRARRLSISDWGSEPSHKVAEIAGSREAICRKEMNRKMNPSHRSSHPCVRVLLAVAVLCCSGFAGAAAAAISSPASTNVIQIFGDGLDGPWIEPAGRKTGGLVTYPTLGVRPFPSHSISLFDFERVLGDGDPRTADTVPFPGASVSLCINGVLPGEYIALAFTAEDDRAIATIAAATYGNDLSAPLTASVSMNAGDFSRAIVAVGPGSLLKKIVVLPYANGAQAMLGETYYFNVKHGGVLAHMICLTNGPGHQL